MTLQIPGYPKIPFPVTNITPFTHRDGLTYLEILETLRRKLNDVIGEVNVNLNDLNSRVIDLVNEAIADVETALAEQQAAVDTALADQQANIDNILQQQIIEFNEALNKWLEITLENNDVITSALINDPNTQTYQSIMAKFVTAEITEHGTKLYQNGVEL